MNSHSYSFPAKYKLIIIFCSIAIVSFSQSSNKFNYDQYNFYRNYGYLETPSSYSRLATAKLAEGDTARAVNYLKKAIGLGAYSMDLFNEKTVTLLNSSFKSKYKAGVQEGIDKNIEQLKDPKDLKVISNDIKLFWKAFDKIDQPNAAQIFMNEYILKGTKGLQTFFIVRFNGNIQGYIDKIRARKNYYKAIRPSYDSIDVQQATILTAAAKLKELYQPSIFPNIYLLIGMMNTGGTPDGGAGQLIGTELFSYSTGVDTSELSSWEQSVIKDKGHLVSIVLHEYVHIQQKHPSATNLMAQCITEGGADFIAQLISNRNINDHIYKYGDQHERELYDRFKREMKGTDYSYWLYNGISALEKGIPADLGYYIGYKICESYYNNALDKKLAIKEIIEVKDFEDFFKRSRYSSKFE